MAKDRKPQSSAFDRLLRAAMKHVQAEFAAWLMGDQPTEVKDLSAALTAIPLRFSDSVLHLRFKDRTPVLLHVEFQVTGEEKMSIRMAQYASLLQEKLLQPQLRGAKLACVVIYLSRRHFRRDPGFYRYRGELGLVHFLRYKVVKLWEVDPEALLSTKNPGLAIFVPLTAGNPLDLAVKSRNIILAAPEVSLSPGSKGDLLAILGGLTARVVQDKKLFGRLFSEVWPMMERNVFFELIHERGMAAGLEAGRRKGLKEGHREGRIEAARRGILKVLRKRFGRLPAALSPRIESLQDAKQLEDLLIEAAVCKDLKAFSKLL